MPAICCPAGLLSRKKGLFTASPAPWPQLFSGRAMAFLRPCPWPLKAVKNHVILNNS